MNIAIATKPNGRNKRRTLARRPSELLFASCLLLAGAGCERETALPGPSDRVDALFAQFTTGIQPGAAVMVIRDGAIVHQSGYGYADLDGQVPITAASTFRLDSVSKQFTAMAVMLLAESGALAYDDPISRFLPALAPYAGVTVRHLLTHTGGLPEYYDVIDTTAGWPANADAVALLAEMAGPVFPAGERFEYSNPGYDVLASLVEAASGMRFADFMRERIFVPLGMQDSLIHDHTRPAIAKRVFGYDPDGEGGYRLNDTHPLNGIVGSGGVYSTLQDLYRWDQALSGERFVSSAAFAQAFTPAVLNKGEPTDYGYGWRIDEYRGLRRLGHGGSWVGFRTQITRYPDPGLTIVILSNRSDLDPDDYVDRIADLYLDG